MFQNGIRTDLFRENRGSGRRRSGAANSLPNLLSDFLGAYFSADFCAEAEIYIEKLLRVTEKSLKNT